MARPWITNPDNLRTQAAPSSRHGSGEGLSCSRPPLDLCTRRLPEQEGPRPDLLAARRASFCLAHSPAELPDHSRPAWIAKTADQPVPALLIRIFVLFPPCPCAGVCEGTGKNSALSLIRQKVKGSAATHLPWSQSATFRERAPRRLRQRAKDRTSSWRRSARAATPSAHDAGTILPTTLSRPKATASWRKFLVNDLAPIPSNLSPSCTGRARATLP